MTESIDTLIARGHLLTMRGAGVGHISDGAIAIKGTRIVEVGPAATRYVILNQTTAWRSAVAELRVL